MEAGFVAPEKSRDVTDTHFSIYVGLKDLREFIDIFKPRHRYENGHVPNDEW